MPCYSPLKGYRTLKNGKNSFTLHRKDAANDSDLSSIACGQCIGCRIQRSKDWAIRCVNEMESHEHSSFLTLTYAPENLPDNGTLQKQHLSTFFKVYRTWLQRKTQQKIRYYACGEYGTEKSRPHYHAIIFGHEFSDKYPWTKINGKQYYRSPQLEKLWPHGTSLFCEANIGTAAYVSKYITKKITGDQSIDAYGYLDEETGEILQIIPEYTTMSTVPGIGGNWLDKYHKTDLTKGYITHEGVKFRIPRYYMDRLEKLDPSLHQLIKESTAARMADKESETYERLLQREKHAQLVLKQELRDLEKA
nr:MAG: replication initiation protein [Microvirus sp.]